MCDTVGVAGAQFTVLQQRIEFEADVTIVSAGLLPDGQEDVLSLLDEAIGHGPGDGGVVVTFGSEGGDFTVETAGLEQVGDDDGIAGSAGGSEGAVAGDELRVDGIEPEFGSGGDKRAKSGRHGWGLWLGCVAVVDAILSWVF
jgi:hypothetical protein